MAQAVVAHGADAGISLDGDADRLIMADEKGQIIDGDQCLAVLADMMASQGELAGRTVVGTLMTNHGLGQYLSSKGVNLERTKVGDRYILERMREAGLNLGGEPSGHIILTDHATSGDGTIAALKMLMYLKMGDAPASESLRRFTPLPQQIVNVECGSQDAIRQALSHHDLEKAVADAENKLGDAGRIVIRPSGTEPLIRIMVEAEDQQVMEDTGQTLAGVISELIT
jgi:phosphoglucosamine mutase